MKALILAGGFGTRLREAVPDVPKPLAPILGKPFLEHQLNWLKSQGIEDIVLAVSHKANQIKSYFGDGTRARVHITYSHEIEPLGTAGAVKNAEKLLGNRDAFLVLNGDSYSELKLEEFLRFHSSHRGIASISLTCSESAKECETVVLEENKINEFKKRGTEKGIINAGVYLFQPEILGQILSGKKVSLENEIFPNLAKIGKLYGFVNNGYFMDIGRPETYEKFKHDLLNRIMINENEKVGEVMQMMDRLGANLILVRDDEERLVGVVNHRILNKYFLRGNTANGSISDAMVRDPVIAWYCDDEEKIRGLMMAGTNNLPILDQDGRIIDVKFKTEEIKTESYPQVSGKAPLRISFAGGGTDKTSVYEKYGGGVVNATIDKYCHVTINKRADTVITMDSDIGSELIIPSIKEIDYNGQHDLAKAIIKVLNPGFGFDIHAYNDVPPGRGLGGSATFAVLVAKLLSQLQGKEYSDYQLAEMAYDAERKELGIGGGWQDQYAAVTGGFNYMEFNGDKRLVYPLRLKPEIVSELEDHLTLCYVGNAHSSGDMHKKQDKALVEREEELVENYSRMKQHSIEVRDCLLTRDIPRIGQILHEAWESKKRIDPSITNPTIDRLYNAGIASGAYGGKLLGAGGGGYLLFFHPATKRNRVVRAFKSEGGEIMDFNFESQGIQTWFSRSEY